MLLQLCTSPHRCQSAHSAWLAQGHPLFMRLQGRGGASDGASLLYHPSSEGTQGMSSKVLQKAVLHAATRGCSPTQALRLVPSTLICCV